MVRIAYNSVQNMEAPSSTLDAMGTEGETEPDSF